MEKLHSNYLCMLSSKALIKYASALLITVFFLFQNTVLFSQTNIDLSKPVGSPKGGSMFNGSGGITYTIPVEVLSGINGLEPTVSLAYSSQGGDGIAGWGWNLTAYSTISRAGKNNYYNGTVSPVSYTNTNDAFVLDGQRLFATSGSNGANGTVYGTENENFNKVESFGGSETAGPDWFRITTKDGKVMEYGHATTTKLLTDNGQSNTMVWLLNRTTDINGNYIDYKYSVNNTDRNFALTEIDYGYNTTTNTSTALFKVLLTYTVKANWPKTKQYQSGSSIASPFLLNTISIVNSAGTTVKSYRTTYSTLRDQSFLQTWTETGADGTSLNPLQFTYGSNTTASNVAISPSYGQFNYNNTFTGDITGDGKEDVIAAYLHYDNNNIPHYNSYVVFDDIGTWNGQAALGMAYQYNMPDATNNAKANQVKAPGGYYSFLTNDYDGDTKKDVLMANWDISGSDMVFNNITINYSRYYSAIQGNTYQTQVYSSIPHSSAYINDFKYSYRNGSTYGTNFIPGDFDGDGVQDYILVLGVNSSNSFKAFFSSPKKGIFNAEILGFGVEGTSTDPFYATSVASATDVVPVDFDGDGKTEILVQKANQSYILSVFPVSASSGYNYAASILYTTTSVKTGYKVFPGDFNGDGATDLLVRPSSNDAYASWYILYSTGKGYVSYPFVWSYRPDLKGDNTGFSNIGMIMVGDFNGDGKSDIWQSLDNATGGLHSSHVVCFSNGMPPDATNYLSAFTREEYSMPQSINKSSTTETVIGDINGDGKTDMMSLLNTRSLFIYPQPFREDRLMTSSTDGLGNKSNYSYSLMNSYYNYQRSYIYEYANGGSAPTLGQNGVVYNVLKSPTYLLSSVNSPNGIGGATTMSYGYQDAVYSPNRGFLGYKQVTSINNSTGVSKIDISSIDPSLLVPHSVRQLTLINGDTISDVKITDTLLRVTNNYFDKRYVYHIDKTLSLNNLTGTALESANTYDSYNNVTSNTIKKGYLSSGVVSVIETITSNTTFGIHGTPVPALPESISISTTRTGQNAVTKQTTYSYDTKGNVLSLVDWAGTSLATTTTKTYDNFGNVKTITANAPNTLTPAITNTYEISGRFLTKKETAGSGITKTETYSYDPTWGYLSSTISSDGVTTSNGYDAYGRNYSSVNANGQQIITGLSWTTQGYGRYISRQYSPTGGAPETKTTYDYLNREISTETSGFNSQSLFTTTSYDYKGQLVSKTSPYYANEPIITTTNSYDVYGRATGSNNGTSSVTISYTKLSNGQSGITTTNAAGQSSTKTQDASGKTIMANDNGGQLNYSYDSWGNQKDVVLGSITLVSSAYDSYGRQTSTTNKNSGTTTYEYDALGQITKQTDAGSHVYTVQYDAFGRIATHTGPEGTISYVYYNDAATGKCNDNITKITGFSGDVTNYVYDNLGKPISQSVVFDGNTFTKTMTYDNLGRLTKTVYPSGVVINDYYDNNGYQIKTTLGDPGNEKTLFNATAMNSKGIYTGYTYGNGKTSTITYDLAKGTPSRYYTAGVQDLNLVFDGQTGNLTSRNDAINNLTEVFTFDNLNRLTEAKVNGVQQFAMTYDNSNGTSLGNIATKSDVGNYVYDANKINAVKYVVSTAGGQTPPGVVSQTQQDISYTPFLKPETISQNGFSLQFTYGRHYERLKTVLKQGATVLETKYFLGAFERQIKGGVTRDIHYINAGNGLCAIVVKENGIVTPYFVYTDHLGSILTVTDAQANVVAKQNFDAWGRNRNPDNWSYTNVPTVPDWLYRGFTGHEHLTQFGLINMNGRLYDPALGRMISPDNYVPMPWNTQGYNGYGYVGNNPLSYNDPNGEFLNFIVGALIGGVVNVVSGILTGKIHSFTDGLKYFGVGALAGAVGAGIGSGISSAIGGGSFGAGFIGSTAAKVAGTSFINGALIGAGSGFSGGLIGGVGNGLVEGQSLGQAFSSGLKTAAIGAVTGGIINGTIQGISAVSDGRRFLDGAKVEKTVVASQKIPLVAQGSEAGNNDCVIATAKSIDGSLNDTYAGKSLADVRADLAPGTTSADPLSTGRILQEYAAKNGNDFSYSVPNQVVLASQGGPFGPTSVSQITNSMASGSRVALALDNPGLSVGHAVVLQSVTTETITKLNGSVITKVIYSVMDPGRGFIRMIASGPLFLPSNLNSAYFIR